MLTSKKLLAPMKPTEQVDGTIVSWKVELVEAWDTGAGAVTRVLVLVREGENRCEVWRGGICGLCL